MDNRIRSGAASEQAVGDLTGNEDLAKEGSPTPRCATAHRSQRAERNSRADPVDVDEITTSRDPSWANLSAVSVTPT